MNRRNITADDLVLYALRLLDESEKYTVEQFLYTSPELRQELALIRGDLATYALGTEMQTPPAMARQRLLKQAAREKKAVPFSALEGTQETLRDRSGERPAERFDTSGERSVFRPASEVPAHPEETPHSARPFGGPAFGSPTEIYNGPTFGGPSFSTRESEYDDDSETPRRSIFAMIFPWFGWAVAAGVAVFALVLHADRDRLAQKLETESSVLATANESAERAQLVLDTINSPASQSFVLTRIDVKPPAMGRVTYLADRGSLVFQGSNLDPLAENKTYELWLIPTGDGRKPIPAGTFRPDSRGFASIILPEMPKGLTASKFGVTVEDGAGADTPTLPIVMIGE